MLLGAPGIATRSKGLTTSNKKLFSMKLLHRIDMSNGMLATPANWPLELTIVSKTRITQ